MDPLYRYKWVKDGLLLDLSATNGRISLKAGSGTLMFNDTLAEDEGMYQCFATGVGTTASSKVYVRKACKYE